MGIYILGMHRSGTSALARFVGLLVDYQADPAVNRHNTAGQWEDHRLNASLDHVLRSLDCDWASPPFDPIGVQETDRASQTSEIDYIVRSLGDDTWVLKDPRLCLALEPILAVPQPPPVLIATYRHPLEVAGSLLSRDRYPLTYGLALWEVYTRCMLLQLAKSDLPWILTSYTDLLESPHDEAAKIGAHLGAQGYRVSESGVSMAAESITPRLRHEAASDQSVMSETQHRLLERLESLKNEHSVTLDEVPELGTWTRDIIDIRRPYGPMERDIRVLRRRTRRIAPIFRAYDGVRRRMHKPTPADPWR